MKQLSKIELSKTLKSIKAVATNEEFEKIFNILVPSKDARKVQDSVNGLSEEDEFALLTKLMKTANYIIGLEQRPITGGEYTIPDFYVSFKPACSIYSQSNENFEDFKCLIDVKSTKKDLFKIGGKDLRKLRKVADEFELPLLFAVRFVRFKQHALWAFVEDDRNSTYVHATYNDIVQGVRNVLWDEYTCMINPKLYIIAEFNKYVVKSSVIHKDFGKQTKLTVTDGNETIELDDGSLEFLYSAFFETYSLEVTGTKQGTEGTTYQYLKPTISTVFLADIVFRMNRLPVDEHGSIAYDAAKLIVRSDAKIHDSLINREYVEVIIGDLIKKKFIFLGIIGDEDRHFKKWKEYGNVETK